MTTKYTKDHEWIRLDSDSSATVGITNHAQETLGDVVFVELPNVGSELKQAQTVGVIESVKAAADIYMPIDGEVSAVNDALAEAPELINQSPEAEGWLFQIANLNRDQFDALLDEAGYQAEIA